MSSFVVWYKIYAPHSKYSLREIHSNGSFCRTQLNPAVSQQNVDRFGERGKL
jgi:hypothetical protein